MTDTDKRKVLLVDDSADFRALVMRFFELMFPDDEIVEYDLAQGAPSELFMWEQYDLLLLDYNLGGGDSGLDWLRRYQTSAEFPPTVMLTGEGNEEIAVKAFQFGAQDYLRKQGLTKTRLRETIEQALEKHAEEGHNINTIGLSNHIFNKSKFLAKLEGLGKDDLALLIEIDRFQDLRDKFGMMTSDRVGAYVSSESSRFLEQAGINHSLIRIGDSSIAGIISAYSGKDRGADLAGKLVGHLSSRAYSENDTRIEYSISVGIVPNSGKGIAIDTILAQLDQTCLEARQKDGDSWAIYDAPEEVSVDQARARRREILEAFRDNRVVPNFQALIKIADAETALDSMHMIRVSMKSPEGQLITPLEFMGTIRENKLDRSLDRWVIQRSLESIQTLCKAQPDETHGIMVTLTEETLTDKELPEWLKKLVGKLGVSDLLGNLVFKMPAEKFLKHEKQALFLMRHIRETLGVQLALDNVSDAASISTIARILKLNYLIFSPCIDGKPQLNDDAVNSIIELAHSHGAFAVANKLESNEYLSKMILAGADFVSGHFIQAPQEDLVSAEAHEL